MSDYTVYLNNDNLLQISLQNAVTGEYPTDAVVTAVIVDSEGAQVAGDSWPLSLSYVADSDGTYRGILSHTLEFVQAAHYTLTIDVDAGVGLKAQFVRQVVGVMRNGQVTVCGV